MKVWIVEQGLYEDRFIAVIYDTPERAMGAHPGSYTRNLWWRNSETYYEDYANDQDWDRHISIAECELTTVGPEAAPAQIVVQRYVSNREWAYDEITAEQADALVQASVT